MCSLIRSKVNRIPERGNYDKETIYKIIDEAKYCHVAFTYQNQPFIIPTIHARMNNSIIVHGAKGSRMLKHISAGNEICIAITLIDAFVLARSVFHHSMNYRSAVIFGKGKLVDNKNEKLEALRIITEHLIPGRWDDARKPDEKELNSTSLVAINIDEASAKIRTGPPQDEKEDYSLPVWAGILPLSQIIKQAIADPLLDPAIKLPDYLKSLYS